MHVIMKCQKQNTGNVWYLILVSMFKRRSRLNKQNEINTMAGVLKSELGHALLVLQNNIFVS